MNRVPAPQLFVYPDRDQLSRAAADRFVESANESITTRGRFAVALSGGSTPRQLYQQLASNAYRARVDWPHVHVFWGDERTVPPDNADSNYRMANETLLSRVPIPQENIHRMLAELDPEVAAKEYEQTLHDFWGNVLPRFDLALLGLGTNGHTASLFPYTSALSERTRECVAVWVPELNTTRLTLTVPVLNHAAQIVFLVSGIDKAGVLREVLRGPYEPERLPAQFIHAEDGELLWLVDQAAASELEKSR